MTALKRRVEKLERVTNAGARCLLVSWEMPEGATVATCEGYTVSRQGGESATAFKECALAGFREHGLSAGTHWVNWQE